MPAIVGTFRSFGNGLLRRIILSGAESDAVHGVISPGGRVTSECDKLAYQAY